MQIGYRANETDRANNMLAQTNADGLLTMKLSTEMNLTKKGWRNKNTLFAWQRPFFPLIEDGIFKQDISKFWEGKPVRFADYNNCAGCFHRNPLFLAKMFDEQQAKMQWFADQEKGRKRGTWRSDIRYEDLKKWKAQRTLDFAHMPGCWSGFCEVA